MMYPFLQLEDGTEIVHSEMKHDGTVKVYIERPIEGGFQSIECYLPDYTWQNNEGFLGNDIEKFQEIIESTAHLIIRFSQEGGFENAASF